PRPASDLYPLSLHDALPIYARGVGGTLRAAASRRTSVRASDLPTTRLVVRGVTPDPVHLSDYQHLLREGGSDVLPAGFVHVLALDRKSTRLNSSHVKISYAV